MNPETAQRVLALAGVYTLYSREKYLDLISNMSNPVLFDMALDSSLDGADLDVEEFFIQANSEAIRRGFVSSNPEDAGDIIKLIRYELEESLKG